MVAKEELKLVPNKPGVYMMIDQNNQVIYVGKALSLRSRVRSYFQPSADLSLRIARMVEQVERVDLITTSSEMEALVLECNLIKEHRPKYNVKLRDDKQYPWLKVTEQEKYPRVFVVRRPQKDGARYFGPYTDLRAFKEIHRLLRRVFPIRNCKKKLRGGEKDRPCLNYHIGRCLGPCGGQVDPKEYRKAIEDFCSLLEGRSERLITDLAKKMEEAASVMEYEKAASYRDQLKALQKVAERQVVVSSEMTDRDVFGLTGGEEGGMIQVLKIRGGKLIGAEDFFWPPEIFPSSETLVDQQDFFRGFLLQYYDEQDYIPKEILLPYNPPDFRALSNWLRAKRGQAVYVLSPQRGEKYRLLKMAGENVALSLEQEIFRRNRAKEEAAGTLERLREVLVLKTPPRRIEAFDLSNLQGEEQVASMVVFEEGIPRSDAYRRFKIRDLVGANDYAGLQEAVKRRFVRGLKEQQESFEGRGFSVFPDLLVIDGGKGQLNAVLEVLRLLGLEGLSVIALAEAEEEIYLPGGSEPLRLPADDPGLNLLRRIRDEAHRFALTYHRILREKKMTRSALDRIKGIGPKRKKALLKKFGSVKRIREATLEELLSVEGISENVAWAILQGLEEL